MHIQRAALLLTLAGVSAADRPANMSICDYYTTGLLKNNTAANQYTLLTLVVNTAVIGNYTQPNVGIKVDGILAPGMFNGTSVNLLPYFDGGLESSNRGGKAGVSVNFLDGGGATPLMKNMPANDTSSNQYFLLTHLYQFFGGLLGCSMYGMGAFPAYSGQASMYQVHSFMDLNPHQLGYFIDQVALSAASFGVAQSDLTAVGMALGSLFGFRCEQPMTAIKAQGPQLQSICTDGNCPLAANATCAAYNPVTAPKNHTSGSSMPAPGSSGSNATSSVSMPSSSVTGTATMKPSTSPSSAAAAARVNVGLLGGALAALLL